MITSLLGNFLVRIEYFKNLAFVAECGRWEWKRGEGRRHSESLV